MKENRLSRCWFCTLRTFFVVRERSSSNLPAPVQLPPQLPRTICRESTRKSNNMLTILEGSVLRNILVRWLPFPPLWLFLAFYWLLPLAWWRLDTDFIGTEENLWRDQFQDFFWQTSSIQSKWIVRFGVSMSCLFEAVSMGGKLGSVGKYIDRQISPLSAWITQLNTLNRSNYHF